MKALKNFPKHSSSCYITIAGIALEVFYDFTPFRRATRDPGGNITEPEEPLLIEPTGLYLIDKEAEILDLFLSITEDDIIEAIYENLSEDADSCE